MSKSLLRRRYEFSCYLRGMASNKSIPQVFSKFWMQIVHFVAVPLFFVSFSLLYAPFDLLEYFDYGPMNESFNLVMVGCIVLLVLTGTRLAFYFLRRNMKLGTELYLLWCVAEMFIISLFMSLYMSLMHGGEAYFTVLGKCMQYTFGVMSYAYLAIALVGFSISYREADTAVSGDDSLIRFKDSNLRLKLAIAASTVLFIEAEENYVRIHYLDGEKTKNYVLRSSMKSIEETVSPYGILRCHRSFFVNPQHIALLRKDRDLGVLADFDVPGTRSIPVSKSYYDAITRII